ncbi:MAG: ATP-dependent zinc metalloprotease FtsH [Eggerthellales bacterium]|nr:ATP-dependent zinc metalloprotease FtsH [Eggerthellales bacterium]
MPNQKKPESPRVNFFLVLILCFAFFMLMQQFFTGGGARDKVQTDNLITSEFVQAVEEDRVVSVVYNAGEYSVTGEYYVATAAGEDAANAFNEGVEALNAAAGPEATDTVVIQAVDPANLGELHNYVSTYIGQDSLMELLSKHPQVTFEVKLPSAFLETLGTILPILLLGGLMVFFFVQMNRSTNSQLGFGKTKARKAQEERPDVKFTDVAGVDEAVEEMREIKDFLANPGKYQAMGAKIPRGCLLVGPPGTGKTLLARAVAGEAGVPFFSISGSDFVEMFVGVGASRVRDLFSQAKEASPAIIFIDEIDAVGRQRGAGVGGGHDEREQTLNQLLVEMDGFDKNDAVVLIAATNRVDILDPALLRPGRFDRQIVVDAPDVKGRKRILEVHSKNKPLGSDVNLDRVASLTPGFTGADLANLMNESALLAARRNKKIITQAEVSESMERVMAGPERKGFTMDERTKKTIAYHESGHALVGHLLEHADPVHKISIISRGRALGYTMAIPQEDKVLNTLGEMRDELAVFMGGRVAEEIFCDDITTGASNDLERATKMARSMVTNYGMSAALGTQVFGQPNHEVFLGRDYGNTQDYSDETARRIDVEVARLMKEAHDRAYEVLTANADQMHNMAAVLLERETVEGEACDALLNNTWEEYLDREVELIAQREREEAEARTHDDEILARMRAENGLPIAVAAVPAQQEQPAEPYFGYVEPYKVDPPAECADPYECAPQIQPAEEPAAEEPAEPAEEEAPNPQSDQEK